VVARDIEEVLGLDIIVGLAIRDAHQTCHHVVRLDVTRGVISLENIIEK
jgi:hypothetical protein